MADYIDLTDLPIDKLMKIGRQLIEIEEEYLNDKEVQNLIDAIDHLTSSINYEIGRQYHAHGVFKRSEGDKD